MEQRVDHRARTLAPVLLGAAVLGFVALALTIGLHPDDERIVADTEGSSYAQIWTSPFLDRFYRPVVVTLVRLALDVFGSVALPLRILQGLLIVACIATLLAMLRDRVADSARYAAALVLLASPLTFISVAMYAVGVGDLIVGWMFLLVIRAGLRGDDARLALVACSVLALLSKESGVLVASYAGYVALRRGWLGVACIVGLALVGYLYFRSTFVARSSFEFSTGYLGATYTADELDARFGASPWGFYLYNVVANLVNALVGFPDHGRLRVHGSLAWVIPAMTLTTVLVARYLTVARRWRELAPLVAIVALNALLGFSYVRSRIMFVAAFAIAVLVGLALDALVRERRAILGLSPRVWFAAFVGLWSVLLGHALVRLALQAGAST